jgi:hypothetical protein
MAPKVLSFRTGPRTRGISTPSCQFKATGYCLEIKRRSFKRSRPCKWLRCGNATAYLLLPTGLTVVSDIDDIPCVTNIFPKEDILNTFVRPFTPRLNTPDIYANWSRSIINLHFHNLTTNPEQITANCTDFTYKTYPLGSFDSRPLSFSDVDATLSIRKNLLVKIFESFPQRNSSRRRTLATLMT